MYLVIIQDIYWVMLLQLQSPQCVLEFCLKGFHLNGDRSLSRMSLALSLYSDLLTVNDLMRKSTPQGTPTEAVK